MFNSHLEIKNDKAQQSVMRDFKSRMNEERVRETNCAKSAEEARRGNMIEEGRVVLFM